MDGLYYLALCYEHGRGTAVAKTKAAATYEKAAKMGHAPSQWNLAVCYLNDSGYECDEVKGYMWAYQAADQGNELAINGLTYQGKTLEQIIDTYKDPETNVTLEGTQYEGRADRCENFRTGTELTYKITKDKDGDEVIELFYNGRTVGLLSKWNSAALLALLKLDRIKLVIKVKSCIPKSKRGARARNADVHLNLIISEKRPETPEERAKRLAGEEVLLKSEKERKRLEAEAKKKAEEERKRKAEERKQKEAERKAEEAKKTEEYLKLHKQWEERCREINKNRSEYIAAERDRLINKPMEKLAKKRDKAVKEANDTIAEQTKRKAEAEETLDSLGAFKFGEKKAQKAIIEEATNLITEAQNALYSAESEYTVAVAKLNKDTAKKIGAVENEAKRRFALPQEPRKPI